MRLDILLLPRCVPCADPLPCNCASNEDCIQINRFAFAITSNSTVFSFLLIRDCNTCSQTQCVPRVVTSTQTSSGVSKGATAGAIVGALLFLAIVVALFLWYRRKMRLRKSIAAQREGKKDIPAPAETVLNRPDPIEKPPPTDLNTVRVYSVSSNTTINLNPQSQRTSPDIVQYNPTNNNPFDDGTSIQTAGTEGTNVIPITLVSPDIHRPSSETTTSTFPVRPVRSPDLNLDHVNVSGDSVRGTTPYAVSQRSGVSGISSRNSFMSNASYSSDFLNEAPMIITSHKGAVRQVLGVVKAEVIKAPGSFSPANSSDGLKPPSLASRPSVGSPLASTSFGPADVVKEVDETQLIDPFSDEASVGGNYNASPAASVTTFGHSSTGAVHDSHSDWVAETPNLPWSRSNNDSRPSSMSTQSGSVVDITSAKRVNVGLSLNNSQLNPDGTPRSSHRTTVGRLVTPNMTVSETLHEQQQRALAHAHARAQAQGVVDQNKRLSGSSVLSGTSTRADSILESFPFVPPSPISNRPVRSPPVSPLGQQSFSGPPSPSGQQHTINVSPPTPHTQQVFTDQPQDFADIPLPPPPDRRMLGLSTASQLSTSSSGLGSFPFQIDSGSGLEGAGAPSVFNGRQRASLDTLALTSDLSSYPLGFDRESVQVPPKS
jgi:protein OPY2